MPFRDFDNMNKFRFLPQQVTWNNEDGLPVGWVKTPMKEKTISDSHVQPVTPRK